MNLVYDLCGWRAVAVYWCNFAFKIRFENVTKHSFVSYTQPTNPEINSQKMNILISEWHAMNNNNSINQFSSKYDAIYSFNFRAHSAHRWLGGHAVSIYYFATGCGHHCRCRRRRRDLQIHASGTLVSCINAELNEIGSKDFLNIVWPYGASKQCERRVDNLFVWIIVLLPNRIDDQ